MKAPGLVPLDWWPKDETIDALVEAHPHHHFIMEDAVEDFIAFTRRRNIELGTDEIDRAFARNIAAILRHRQPGQVTIGSPAARRTPRSVLSLLAGRR